ncbi:MAG: pyridoxal 5'-phosphate synthase glutaminase subunit PdxT [Pseudomonadota bacterium]
MNIGVLALQGDFEEHSICLRKLGVRVTEVRLPSHLDGLDGLIIPGGESTTIGKLATDYRLVSPILEFAKSESIWGTCGGLVLMAKDVGMKQPILGLIDMTVERNAFGRQIDSFEENLEIQDLDGGLFRGVFIRAPRIARVGPEVKVMCKLKDGSIVAVRQDRYLATSFHPELTEDNRLLKYFLRMISTSD